MAYRWLNSVSLATLGFDALSDKRETTTGRCWTTDDSFGHLRFDVSEKSDSLDLSLISEEVMSNGLSMTFGAVVVVGGGFTADDGTITITYYLKKIS